jgi:mycothiol synthase
MIFRAFRWDDFDGVSTAILSAAAHDRTKLMTVEQLRTRFELMNNEFAPTIIATDGRGTVSGFAWWTIEPDDPPIMRIEGWVHPDHRRCGVGTGLLLSAERYGRGIPGMELMGRSYDDVLGVAPLYRQRGFKIVRQFYAMMGPIVPDLEASFPSGVEIRMFAQTQLASLVEAENRFFADHWGVHTATIDRYYRLLSEPDVDSSLWVVAWVGDRIVGECITHPSELRETDCWISIVGVDAAWRNRGIGRAMLAECYSRLAARGFRRVGLHVDSENAPAVKLYSTLGMRVMRTRLHFSKFVRDNGA